MTVILADDEQDIREVFRPFLQRLGDAVQVLDAASLYEVLEFQSLAMTPDLILMDIHMPGLRDAAPSLDAVRAAFPHTPVVIMSGYADPDLVNDAIKHGARGYVPKTMIGREFVTALKSVLAGEVYLPKCMALE